MGSYSEDTPTQAYKQAKREAAEAETMRGNIKDIRDALADAAGRLQEAHESLEVDDVPKGFLATIIDGYKRTLRINRYGSRCYKPQTHHCTVWSVGNFAVFLYIGIDGELYRDTNMLEVSRFQGGIDGMVALNDYELAKLLSWLPVEHIDLLVECIEAIGTGKTVNTDILRDSMTGLLLLQSLGLGRDPKTGWSTNRPSLHTP